MKLSTHSLPCSQDLISCHRELTQGRRIKEYITPVYTKTLIANVLQWQQIAAAEKLQFQYFPLTPAALRSTLH